MYISLQEIDTSKWSKLEILKCMWNMKIDVYIKICKISGRLRDKCN